MTQTNHIIHSRMHTAADGSYGLFFIICDGEMIVGTIYARVHLFFALLSLYALFRAFVWLGPLPVHGRKDFKP